MHRDRSRPPLGRSPDWDPVAERRVPASIGAQLAPGLVFVAAILVYVRTLMPGMAFDDWGEMQTVPHILGIAHPTGYPTYILSAYVFELLPFGSIAFRANLYAAFCVAVALAAMTATAQRLGIRPVIAGMAALATGAVATVWASATVSEVNPLHLALISLIINRSLAWADERRPRDLALGGLLIGLALGNHLLTAFVAPFLVLFALWEGRWTLIRRKRLILAPIVAGLLGLSVYIYIPLAASLDPALPYNHPTTWNGFVFLVAGEQFQGQYDGLFTAASLGRMADGLAPLWALVVDRATVVVPVVGAIGLGVLLVKRTAFGLALLGILLVGIDIWANYLQLEHYLLVPFLVLGIGMAVAVEAGARLAEDRGSRLVSNGAAMGAALAGGVLVLALVGLNLPRSDRSADVSGQTYVDTLFAALPSNAAILSFWGASTPLWHAQQVLGERPDVLVVDDTNIVYEGWRTRENRIAALICKRPVFMLRPGGSDLDATRAQFDLNEVLTVTVGAGGPSGTWPLPVYQVTARPGTCS